MDQVVLDYAVPPDDLSAYITLFYRFEADVPQFEDLERADHAQFRFRLQGGESRYHFYDGEVAVAPPIHVLAATKGATRTFAAGPLRVFGMGLTPAGWEALLDIDASSAHRLIDAEVMLGPAVAHAFAELCKVRTTAEMQEVVVPLMRRLLAGTDSDTLVFVRIVDDWLTRRGAPDIDVLANAAGLSRRQVERRCNRLYGAPPKLLARKYRALRAAVALASGAAGDDPGLLDDFYDQSHMIREIKQFAGVTPRRLREAPGALATLTIGQRLALGGRVARIISET